MASLTASEVVIGAAAVVVVASDGDGSSALISNASDTTVHIGGVGVSVAAGFPLPVGAAVSIDVPAGIAVYAVCAAEGKALRVLIADR